ncbi:Uncharacterised protein [Escherichia coli]|nr:Uncharacterised protein [Escherichia coli]
MAKSGYALAGCDGRSGVYRSATGMAPAEERILFDADPTTGVT